jgi:glyoxylase-like metal-dependent hydrolase (beta-lactamase superfamily II)
LLLVGDLTYEVDLLLKDQVTGLGIAAQLRSSFAKVLALKQALPDLVILPSHDPSAAEALAAFDTVS